MNTNFQNKRVLKEIVLYKCLSFVMLNSVIRINKTYYLQTLPEGCKYETKNNNYDLEQSSS